jgi:hypothetical protein
MSVIGSYHNYGFFSCCSVRLQIIVEYLNYNKILPDIVDTSKSFNWYKTKGDDDVTFDYFEDYTKIKNVVKCDDTINFCHDDQYNNYSKLDYKNLEPLIEKYFTPTLEIKEIIKNMEKKYELDYKNTCVLFYRGNDKNRETQICDYSEYISYAKDILESNPSIKFLIQSDETEFIETIRFLFPENSFYFNDEIRHMKRCDDTVDKCMRDNIDLFSKYYLAITIIMSKCEYVVCGSGNCSLWIMFYRGNSKNIIQNLSGEWLVNS